MNDYISIVLIVYIKMSYFSKGSPETSHLLSTNYK